VQQPEGQRPAERHCDPDVLALWALGEAVDAPADIAHLDDCALCAADLLALRGTVAAGRGAGAAPLVSPPPRVWDSIAAELALGAALREDLPVRLSESAEPTVADPAVTDPTVVRLDSARRSRRAARSWRVPALAAAACLAGLLAGVAGTLALTGDDEPGSVVARTTLDPLPQKTGRGEAVLAGTSDDRTLRVTVSGLDATNGFFEVWVLNPTTLQMQSLGVLRGSQGQFAVPAGLDLRSLSVVDVSLEPFDGNPAHSRDSVVRGALTV